MTEDTPTRDRAIALLTERETHSISEATRCFAAAEHFSRRYGFEDDQAVNARKVADGFMKDAAAFRWAVNALEPNA